MTKKIKKEKKCPKKQDKLNYFVPVVDSENNPLMPTTLPRAMKWIKSKKATYFYKNHIFCVRLNQEPSNRKTQEIVIAVDPGSKFEGYTVKSTAHTYWNVNSDAVTWVKDAVKSRRETRRSRRNRKTPCRKNKFYRNRNKDFLPPSTKARWQAKLRIINQLLKVIPIDRFGVEDISAESKPKEFARSWNKLFSPLEVGKKWFYSELEKLGMIAKFEGWETANLRFNLGLPKLKDKSDPSFYSHCVDSWVMANQIVGGHVVPDNTSVIKMVPLQFHRRELHKNASKGGKRREYGGTMSLGFKRGNLIKHKKYGICYIGGTREGRISLHNKNSGERLCQNAKKEEIKFLCYNSFRVENVN